MSVWTEMEEPLRSLLALSHLVRHMATSDFSAAEDELIYLADGLENVHDEFKGIWEGMRPEGRQVEGQQA